MNNATVTELADTRRQILAEYDGSTSQYERLVAIEAAILCKPHDTDADRKIKRSILFENREPDFADRFIQKLAMSLC